MIKFESNIVTSDVARDWNNECLAVQEQAEALACQLLHVTLDAYAFDSGNGTTSQHYLLTLRHLEEHEYDVAAAKNAPAVERLYAFDEWDVAREAFFAALQHKMQGNADPII